MQNDNFTQFVPHTPIPPGDTLLEVLEERGITQAEFASRLGRPNKTVNGIIKGKVAITPETALQFEQVLNIPAYFWNNIEAQYQELKLRIESEEAYKEMIEQSKLYPYSEMAGWGWVPQTKNPLKKVQNLLKFFGVTNFENIVEETKLQGAFRISEKHKYSLPAIVSWVRKGSVDAESIQVEDFDEAKVKDALPVLRSMTNNDEPNKLIPEIQELLRKCGIAFVVTPSIKNAPISGVTRWVTPNKALIHMSLRWGWSDIFWFSLFHEIGHILLDNKKDFNIDLVNKTIDGVQEHEKDVFAANTLIPQEKYAAFASKFSTSQNQYELIKTFARGVNVHPGIVVGRLQHDGRLAPNMNGLRVRFAWKKNKKQGI